MPCSNMSRTRLAPTPTNISTKSEPEMVKNGTLASPATARASQGLTGTRRADQQHALGDLAAQALELLRVLQELDDFLKLLLRLVDAGDVIECHPADLLGQQARPRFAEAHGLAAAGLHLAHEEYPYADQKQHREPGQQHTEQRRHIAVVGHGADPDAAIGQAIDHIGIWRGIGAERAAISEMTADLIALDRHIRDLAPFDLVQEVAERHSSPADYG